jgi:hypothetical protein
MFGAIALMILPNWRAKLVSARAHDRKSAVFDRKQTFSDKKMPFSASPGARTLGMSGQQRPFPHQEIPHDPPQTSHRHRHHRFRRPHRLLGYDGSEEQCYLPSDEWLVGLPPLIDAKAVASPRSLSRS